MFKQVLLIVSLSLAVVAASDCPYPPEPESANTEDGLLLELLKPEQEQHRFPYSRPTFHPLLCAPTQPSASPTTETASIPKPIRTRHPAAHPIKLRTGEPTVLPTEEPTVATTGVVKPLPKLPPRPRFEAEGGMPLEQPWNERVVSPTEEPAAEPTAYPTYYYPPVKPCPKCKPPPPPPPPKDTLQQLSGVQADRTEGLLTDLLEGTPEETEEPTAEPTASITLIPTLVSADDHVKEKTKAPKPSRAERTRNPAKERSEKPHKERSEKPHRERSEKPHRERSQKPSRAERTRNPARELNHAPTQSPTAPDTLAPTPPGTLAPTGQPTFPFVISAFPTLPWFPPKPPPKGKPPPKRKPPPPPKDASHPHPHAATEGKLNEESSLLNPPLDAAEHNGAAQQRELQLQQPRLQSHRLHKHQQQQPAHKHVRAERNEKKSVTAQLNHLRVHKQLREWEEATGNI
jgi:hypothetical protein